MRKLSLKQRRWIDAYIETGNCTEAARRAKYKAKDDRSFSAIGLENLEKLRIHIQKFLDEVGLSDEAIKLKISQGMIAKKVIIRKIKGAVNPNDLPPGYRLITTTGKLSFGENGEEFFSDGDSLIEIELEALEIQHRYVSLGAEVQGLKETELSKRVTELERHIQSERERK